MGSRRKLVCLGGALPTVVLVAHGCRGPTQVTLDLDTNVACADLRGVDIVVAEDVRKAEERAALVSSGPRFASATTTACTEGAIPRKIGTLVVTPSGGSGAVVVVAAFGGATLADCTAARFASQCIVARRRFAFVENRSLVLPVLLDPECAGVPCDEASTCVASKCVDSTVACIGDTCSEPGRSADGGLVEVDARPLVDAAPPPFDGAGTDAGEDAATDAPPDVAPAGTCPASAQCLATTGDIICPVGASCCYATDPAECKAQKTCAGMTGCCRGSEDCPRSGDVCCADTAVPGPQTRVACMSNAACVGIGGVAVCSTVAPGCGVPGRPCDIPTLYSTSPEFFRCS